METLDPSIVRRRVLDEHDHIRHTLEQIETLAEQLDRPGAPTALRRELLVFLPFLEHHMALEEEILVPALQDADAFGDVRTDMMHEHHQRFHAEADALRKKLRDTGLGPTELAGLAAHVVAHVRAEMADEEKTLLRPDILKDDLITTGVGG